MLSFNGLLTYSECRAEVSYLCFYVNLLKHKVQYSAQRISLWRFTCRLSVLLLVLVSSLRLAHPLSPCSVSHSLHGSLCTHMGFAKWTHTEYFIRDWFPPSFFTPPLSRTQLCRIPKKNRRKNPKVGSCGEVWNDSHWKLKALETC